MHGKRRLCSCVNQFKAIRYHPTRCLKNSGMSAIPSTQEAGTEGWGLEASLGYRARPSLKVKNKKDIEMNQFQLPTSNKI